MEIKDFERIRVGSGYPACFDMKPINFHESYGIYATITEVKNRRIELRKNIFGEVALFNFLHDDLALPKCWVDSEILWSNKEEIQC